MRKITALLIMLVAATGCDNGPVGRYQMVTNSYPDGAAGTFILDTKNGNAWKLQENEFWPFPVVKSDAATRNAELKARLSRLEAAAKQPDIPIPQGEITAEEKESLLKKKREQIKVLKALLAVEKQKRGLPPSPEELEALREMTAND
jgi:hypothetical protein